MKKNKIKNILFLAGVAATEAQVELALKHHAVIRNAKLVPNEGAPESNDGVFGEVPKIYATKTEDEKEVSNIVEEAQKDYEALKSKTQKAGSSKPGDGVDREALKSELDGLGVKYAKNAGNETLAKLLEEAKASSGDDGDMLG